MAKEKNTRITKRSLPRGVKVSVKAGQEKKGEDAVVLDLREITTFTDYFIIINGNSSRQNIAISEHIQRELKKEKIKLLGTEGMETGEWVLMDYGSFIVHVFSREKRDYYALEKLWGDARKFLY